MENEVVRASLKLTGVVVVKAYLVKCPYFMCEFERYLGLYRDEEGIRVLLCGRHGENGNKILMSFNTIYLRGTK